MERKKISVEVERSSLASINSRQKSLQKISDKLTDKELEKFAWVLENDPFMTGLAKQHLGL